MLTKISSTKEIERKRQRMQIFFTVFIIGVLGASTASFALFSSDSDVQKYNGKRFYRVDGGWQGKDLNFITLYLPQDVEDISLEGDLSFDLFSNKVYIVSDLSRTAAFEWARAVPMGNIQSACLPEQADEEQCADLPLKDCRDADYSNAVIIFKEENNTKVTSSGSCVEISGDSSGIVKATDKAIFTLYGLM